MFSWLITRTYRTKLINYCTMNSGFKFEKCLQGVSKTMRKKPSFTCSEVPNVVGVG